MSRSFSNNPTRRRRIASSSPQSLFWKGYFWRAQKDFWVIMGGSLVAFILLAPYTYNWDVWVVLTIGVQALAFWGALITARAMTRIEVETAIVSEVEANGAAYLSAIKGNPESRVTLDQLEESILPHNATQPPLSMIRLFQHICKEARDRRFESSISLIEPYREEALEDVFRLQNIQKIALWLGILGTFIGLLGAIQAIDFSNESNDAFFAKIIQTMFENLFISFSASLAGLEVAIILGVLLLLLRRRQERYFQSMESAVVTMLSLARNALNKDDFFVEFSQVRQAMDGLKDEIYHQTRTLSGDMSAIQGGMGQQSAQIQNGIDKLIKTRAEFDAFLNQIGSRHQSLIDDVKSVYDAISLRNLGVTLEESIVQAGRHISDTLHPNVTQIGDQLATFNKALELLRHAIETQSKSTAEQVNRIQAEINRSERQTFQISLNDWNGLVQQLSRLNRTLERTNLPARPRPGRLREIFTTIGGKLSNIKR